MVSTADSERLQYLEVFEKFSGVMGDFVEFDEEKDDFLQLFVSTKSLEQAQRSASQVVGKYSKRDLMFAKEVIIMRVYLIE
jgi:hypothetical protein